MSVSLVLAALAAPAADAVWEDYACEGGPVLRLALVGGRPATEGYLQLGTGIVTLTRQPKEPPAVLRGDGHMVRPFNWIDILYAAPGAAAVQCRLADAAAKPGAPSPE